MAIQQLALLLMNLTHFVDLNSLTLGATRLLLGDRHLMLLV
jgi:hypothetical protein